jgi:hypothetical protein
MFIASLSALGAAALLACGKKKSSRARRDPQSVPAATVFRALNGGPAENMEKVLSLMGGVGTLFGPEDIVILKPNLQWYNQGAPNVAAFHRLVALIMERPGGFRGEIVLAENIHRGAKPWTRGAWATPFARNSDLPGVVNYNDLADRLSRDYGDRFSVCHLIDIASGGARVFAPADGPGYILCDGTGGVPLLVLDNGLQGPSRREVVMSYPVLKTRRGTLVDYRRGVWEKGRYTEQPVKFVNCAALNHHSVYGGVTSAVKNYLGVSDLSGGPDPAHGGRLAGRFHNFHSFPFSGDKKGPVPGMLGAEVGYFLKTVRRPFLNITTAEFCGLAGRTGLPVARTRVVAASTDPVALDYHTSRDLLFANSRIPAHDPDAPGSPVARYLARCAEAGEYCAEAARIEVKSFDIAAGRFQDETDLAVRVDREWGSNARSLLKYAILRVL